MLHPLCGVTVLICLLSVSFLSPHLVAWVCSSCLGVKVWLLDDVRVVHRRVVQNYGGHYSHIPLHPISNARLVHIMSDLDRYLFSFELQSQIDMKEINKNVSSVTDKAQIMNSVVITIVKPQLFSKIIW